MKLGKILGRGANSVVYEAFYRDKVYAAKTTSLSDLNFRKEAAALARLNHPNLVKLEELAEFEGKSYLIMELVSGRVLTDIIREGLLPEPQIRRTAIDISQALAAVHSRGLVHRDIKPGNVMIQANKVAKIIDFGFAARTQVLSDNQDAHKAVGTFYYSSPEQIGVLKRPVDARSDLYSLGCLLYECASGKPPFLSENMGDLIQQHLSVQPVSLHELNPHISPEFAAMVGKLLAKEPDDRYQSAEEFLAALGSDITVNAIPLLGRSAELDELKRLWSKAQASQGAVVQIQGEGGSGKTRLARELIGLAESPEVLVLSGKANQSEQMPFGPIRDAINRYVARGQTELTQVQEVAGEFAPILKRLVKTLEVSHEDPVADESRFYRIVADFFLKLTRIHGAAILHIDDVQWIDEGSLEVLKILASQASLNPILIILTTRNDFNLIPSSTILLKPLDFAAANELIAYHLGGKPLDRAVVKQLLTKTNGNPFALGEYIFSLLEAGALRPEISGWVFDSTHFGDLVLPSDVIQLLINRISQLSPGTQRVLTIASLVGFEFDESLLPESESHAALMEGIKNSILEKDGSVYNFIHDRMREALIQSLKPEEFRHLNQELAEKLDKIAAKSTAQNYALARFYRDGESELPQNHQKIFETHLIAGKSALENHANEESFRMLDLSLTTGQKLNLKDEALNPVREALGLAATRIGRQNFALSLLSDAMKTTQLQSDRVRLQYLIALAYSSQGNNQIAWTELQKALAMLGAAFPKSFLAQLLSLFWAWGAALFLIRTGWTLKKPRPQELERRKMISAIHNTGNLIAHFLGKPFLLTQNIIRELYNAQFQGASSEKVKAHASYGTFLANVFGNKAGLSYHRRIALTLGQQIGDQEALAFTKYCCNASYSVVGDIALGDDLMRQSLPDMNKYLTAWDRSGMLNHVGVVLSIQGKSREAAQWLRNAVEVCRNAENHLMAVNSGCMLTVQLSLLGLRSEAEQVRIDTEADFSKITYVKLAQCNYYGHQILRLLDREDFSSDAEAIIEKFLQTKYFDFHTRIYYIALAHFRLEQYLRHQGSLKTFKSALKRAQFPSMMVHCPVFQCHFLILKAALARENGQLDRSWHLLKEARKQAALGQTPWGIWLIARERARTAAAEGDMEQTTHYAQLAYNFARNAGWIVRATQIRQAFGLEDDKAEKMSNERYSLDNINTQRTLEALLRLSLTSVRVVDPDKLSKITLDEMIKVLGAERGFFFEIDPVTNEQIFKYGRDAFGNDLTSSSKYSTTVVERTRETLAPLIVTSSDEGESLGSKSISIQNLRSIMAGPVMMGKQLIGILYLDSSLVKGLFTKEDMSIFHAMANHIAVSLEGARTAKEHEQLGETIRVAHAAGRAEVSSNAIHAIGNSQNLIVMTLDFMKRMLKKPELPKEDFVRKFAILEHSVETISSVITDLQKYVKREFLKEPLQLSALVEEALGLQSEAMKGHVTVRTRYEQLPPVISQKNKLLNIIKDILLYARDSMATVPAAERVILIETFSENAQQKIRVSQAWQGPMIDKDSLFMHGSPLHMSANAIAEIGGKIDILSDPNQKNLSFIISL